jgi:hypothetical protein
MKILKIILIVFSMLFFFINGLSILNACSFDVIPPLTIEKNDNTFLAFSGKVKGYTVSNTKIYGFSNVPGLKVEITEPLICPQESKEAEIYPFVFFIDCSPMKLSLDELQGQYKLGVEVSVIGYALGSVKDYKSFPLKVLTRVDFGYVSLKPENAPIEKNGLLNFYEFKKCNEKDSYNKNYSEDEYNEAYSMWYEDYEYLKCLMKLNRATSKEEKFEILTNMASYWMFCKQDNPFFWRDRYKKLVKEYHLGKRMTKLLMKNYDKLHKKNFENFKMRYYRPDERKNFLQIF